MRGERDGEEERGGRMEWKKNKERRRRLGWGRRWGRGGGQKGSGQESDEV